MNLEFDWQRYPDLTSFRRACLDGRHADMAVIADKGHEWYRNENPDGISMEKLAKTFQAQFHASSANLAELRSLISQEPWVANHPWTAQGWLPITQAVSTHGDRGIIDLLIEAGADLSLMVGDVSDRASIPDMARAGGHEELAQYIEALIGQG